MVKKALAEKDGPKRTLSASEWVWVIYYKWYQDQTLNDVPEEIEL